MMSLDATVVLVAALSLAGSIYSVWAGRRPREAEADNKDADSASKLTGTALQMVESVQQDIVAMRARLREVEDENRRLRAELAVQQAEVATLRSERTRMNDEIVFLKEQNVKLNGEVAKLRRENEQLRNGRWRDAD